MLPIRFELNPGDSFTHTFGGEQLYTISLFRVVPRMEPLYQHGLWFDVFRDAQVDLLLDGEPLSLKCAPYQLPVLFHGLLIEVDLVKEVAGGLHTIPLDKAVRLCVLAADLPWVLEDLVDPMPDGRWRASNYIHTWNGFVHVVEYRQPPSVYYHRGEDLGAYPDRHPFVSCIDGICKACPPSKGDGDSNIIQVENEEMGIGICYCHANADTINPELVEGRRIIKGERLALTGSTWAGHCITDPHLHMGFYRAGKDKNVEAVNAYASYVAAYRKRFPNELLPVAGGYRFTRVNEPLECSAERSIACNDSGKIRYQWELTDGTRCEGEKILCCYAQAGVYTEVLKMSDICGRIAYDTVMIFVSDGICQMLPFATLNAWPMRDIHIDTEVSILAYVSNLTEASIDFGDGCRQPITSASGNVWNHVWQVPGDYIVTLSGRSEDSQGIFKIVVQIKK